MQSQRYTKRIAQDAPIGVLYQRYAPGILTYIRRHISSPEDAEDLLVEVFLAALERNNLLCLNEGEQLYASTSNLRNHHPGHCFLPDARQ